MRATIKKKHYLAFYRTNNKSEKKIICIDWFYKNKKSETINKYKSLLFLRIRSFFFIVCVWSRPLTLA
jgi:hypothetical protein